MKVPRRNSRGFVLLECMLAVAIFALGILALGRCVENCLKAEKFRREEGLAIRALANYWIQVEQGAVPITENVAYPLKGAWEGMTMNVSREALTLKNEKDQELFGLYQVKLQLSWPSNGEVITRDLQFFMYPRQR
jgi:prepilin-type N-terminal cleavage/methylation domain-containing protein